LEELHVNTLRVFSICIAVSSIVSSIAAAPPEIYFQAHRGGLDEVPENTLVALEHAWAIPGAVPEVDIRTTKDGVPVIIHDTTPKRTTNAPADWADKPIREIPFKVLREWDAGLWFDANYAGAQVPSLGEVIVRLKAAPDRQLYIDLKEVDTDQLIGLLKAHEVTDRVIFVHGSPAMCETLSAAWPGARTMTWLSGEPASIKTRFRALAATGFTGVSQIQLHLRPKEGEAPGVYELDQSFLEEAMASATAAGVVLQVRPFVFDPQSIRNLIDLGVHWYVADAPRALREAIEAALAL